MANFEFRMVDPGAVDGYRDLDIEADDVEIVEREGLVVAIDTNDKIRAACASDNFIHLDRQYDAWSPDPENWGDVRHQYGGRDR